MATQAYTGKIKILPSLLDCKTTNTPDLVLFCAIERAVQNY
jgi:hypothetical protein